MPQAIEHVYIVDRYGHVIRGYYEDNVTSVITGFAYVDKQSYPLDPLGAIIGGFPASMNGETVTLKASGIAKQMAYDDGDYVISLEHDFDRLPIRQSHEAQSKDDILIRCSLLPSMSLIPI